MALIRVGWWCVSLAYYIYEGSPLKQDVSDDSDDSGSCIEEFYCLHLNYNGPGAKHDYVSTTCEFFFFL